MFFQTIYSNCVVIVPFLIMGIQNENVLHLANIFHALVPLSAVQRKMF